MSGFFVYSFFFFKQKTAYEIMPSLVGSEIWIRDRRGGTTLTPRSACNSGEFVKIFFRDFFPWLLGLRPRFFAKSFCMVTVF